jgi:tetratricopeptide (TPR) repeat protein
MKKRTALMTALFLLQISFFLGRASATTLQETVQLLREKVESWDVEEVRAVVLEALEKEPDDADLLETASHIAFYRGEYEESLRLMKRSMEVGGEDESRRGFALFIEETIHVLAPYTRYETPHFLITLDGKQDGVLVDYLAEALEKTYEVMSRQYGFGPGEKVRVELFPDTRAFYLCSTLSVRDIEVTGAVGLTKFNKLQFLSPRALMHGYRWLDAISHEYVHYLIVKLTANRAPIWFHEGLAKYEETRWRRGPTYLSPLYRSLLAQALADHKLIGFDKMEPSLVRLETPEEVQLAYAQAASAIEFIIRSAGEQGLKKIMDCMAGSTTKGAGEAIRDVLGMNFTRFEEKWAAYLAAKDLKPVAGAAVPHYKVKEDNADEERMDLEEIKSLVARNRAHLGDRLKERGRTSAAILEYRRALSESEASVPVMNRLSSALIGLGRDEEALEVLKRTLLLAPDHPTPYTQLGRVYLKRKDFEQAREAFKESLQISPFNPEIHVGLAEAYAMLGNATGAAKERSIAQKLRW